MSRYTERIRPYVEAEIRLALNAEAHGGRDLAWRHLERAHILGQRSTRLHVRVHVAMLRMALRRKRPGETLGQVWRVAAAAAFTPLGLLPAGNTGGADVSGFRPLPIPDDLQRLIGLASK